MSKNVSVKVSDLKCPKCGVIGEMQLNFYVPASDTEGTLHWNPGKMGPAGFTIGYCVTCDDFTQEDVKEPQLWCFECRSVFTLTEVKEWGDPNIIEEVTA